MDQDGASWDEYRRVRRRARFAIGGVIWGLLGSLALMEIAEVAFGFPHLPVIAYGVSCGFAIWSGFAIRRALKTPTPGFPRLPPHDDDEPPPLPFHDLPRGPVPGLMLRPDVREVKRRSEKVLEDA